MKTEKSRSQQHIFSEMHRELRAWNPQIPESPERLDPVLRIVLQLFSSQLARIDSRVDRLWDVASDSLLKSLYPECKRWPIPSHTVMQCEPIDPVVTIDPHTRFYYREAREGGQTFFFSSQCEETLVKAELKQAILRFGTNVVDITANEGGVMAPGVAGTPSPEVKPLCIYLAIDHIDRPADFSGTPIFLKGNSEALRQLHWARWYPGSASGEFYEDSGFCPGLTTSIDDIVTASGSNVNDWGGLRSNSDMFRHLENNFVMLPEAFAGTWELGPPEPELLKLMGQSGIVPAADGERCYWVRIDLPPGGDKKRLLSPLEGYFGAFLATNKNELTLFKHTGGNRIVEIELPEPIDHVLDVTSVVDSTNKEYFPQHVVQPGTSAGSYSLEDRNNRLILWFDFSSTLETPPESITVTYSVTAGVSANGIEAGQIGDLYENHPGIESVRNLLPAVGAVPAKTEEQIITEVSARLRGRDRALSFSQISEWAASFDSRIRGVDCSNGVERGQRGVRRCIVVAVSVTGDEFYSDDELQMLQERLQNFLKSRAPVNTQFNVEISRV